MAWKIFKKIKRWILWVTEKRYVAKSRSDIELEICTAAFLRKIAHNSLSDDYNRFAILEHKHSRRHNRYWDFYMRGTKIKHG